MQHMHGLMRGGFTFVSKRKMVSAPPNQLLLFSVAIAPVLTVFGSPAGGLWLKMRHSQWL